LLSSGGGILDASSKVFPASFIAFKASFLFNSFKANFVFSRASKAFFSAVSSETFASS